MKVTEADTMFGAPEASVAPLESRTVSVYVPAASVSEPDPVMLEVLRWLTVGDNWVDVPELLVIMAPTAVIEL